MNNSNHGTTTTKCFSGFLTTVLCRGSLPTHPSDHNDHTPEQEQEQTSTTRFIDLLKQESRNEKQQVPSSTAPGIVARLMGLETLPDLEWVPKSRLSDSYSRSRSVNSMDFLVQFNHPPLKNYHRRVKTSVSFREVPAGISQQSQECFVFYLDNVDREKREFLRGEEKKTEQNREKMAVRKTEQNREKVVVVKKQSKTGKSLNGNDEPMRVSSSNRNCSKVGDCRGASRKTSAISKAKNPLKIAQQKKKKNQLVVKEAKSEEGEYKKKSSPVSVMDVKNTSIRHESPEVPKEVNLKSRKNHPKRRTNFEYPSPQITLISNNDGFKKGASKNKEKKEMKINGETEYYVKLLGEIYRLTETECKEERTYWVGENNVLKKCDEFEEVCVEFGQKILDQLVYHLIYELSGDHML